MSNSPDYLTYKKSKMNPQKIERQNSRLKVVLWIFVITFSLIFAVVVQVVHRYSMKMDIEYGRNSSVEHGSDYIDDAFGRDSILGSNGALKKSIDKRLKLIQLEENAPNEGKVVEKKESDEVIDPQHYEMLKETNELDEESANAAIENANGESGDNSGTIAPTPSQNPDGPEIYTFSKVLIGKYPTFEAAKAAQNELRNLNQSVTPFVRKVGDIYALQVGSFASVEVAKSVAQKFRNANYDVWIYQQ